MHATKGQFETKFLKQFLDVLSIYRTGDLVGWLVTLSTLTERPQRLATFQTFDQSDEAK